MRGAAVFLAGLAVGAAGAAAAGFYLRRREIGQLGRLISFAGHEINTPLTAVNMTALNFLSGIFGDIPEDQAKWMQLMRAQTSRMGSIVGELRDLIHHVMRRDLVVYVEPSSVAEAVESVLRAVGSSVAESDVKVKTEVGELPAVMADPDRLFRSISSMLFHARKFRTAGDITITARALQGEVETVVTYHGAKMSAEDAENSLDLYYPAKRRKDQQLCSVGMGLGMLKLVARLQGGDFGFSVDADGVSRMAMRLPTTLKPPAVAALRPS
ncbi:MAG: HAMP domain-containing histidine kinase [Elusimicrobia bacterium]|nr:HAMP domain-containing histidine kinase [Elusimicrobiota bacterium]